MLAPRLETQIVGDKTLAALAEKLFDDGMAATDDEQFASGIEFGANVAAVGGELGKSCKNIQLRNSGSRATQARGVGGNRRANVDKELALNFENALVGSKDFALVFFKLG